MEEIIHELHEMPEPERNFKVVWQYHPDKANAWDGHKFINNGWDTETINTSKGKSRYTAKEALSFAILLKSIRTTVGNPKIYKINFDNSETEFNFIELSNFIKSNKMEIKNEVREIIDIYGESQFYLLISSETKKVVLKLKKKEYDELQLLLEKEEEEQQELPFE